MNREGRVLSASIARGSGYVALDREALATLRRAEPLPRIPPDRPVEFFTTAIPRLQGSSKLQSSPLGPRPRAAWSRNHRGK